MATLLARRAGVETPLATNDTHQQIMTDDPSIPQFPSSGFGGGFAASASVMPMQQGSQPPHPTMNQAEMLKSGDGAMQEGGTTTLATDDKFGKFINTKWRPLMAVIYMITCFCDFVLFPILWSLLQALSKGQVTSQWMPLTLQGAGLYHIALGAILGIAAYGRTQEKIASKA